MAEKATDLGVAARFVAQYRESPAEVTLIDKAIALACADDRNVTPNTKIIDALTYLQRPDGRH